EHLELARIPRIFDRTAGAMQNVEQQRFEHIWIDRARIEVKGLEQFQCERVLGIVEEMPELSCTCPSLEMLAERPNHCREIGQCSRLRIELVSAFNGGIQATFFRPI